MRKLAPIIVLSIAVLAIAVFALAPDQPTVNYPTNNSQNIVLNPVLNITPTDPDSATVDVDFIETLGFTNPAYDEDGDEFAFPNRYYYVNYTTPSIATGYTWTVAHGNTTNAVIYNITEMACWNSTVLQFRFYSLNDIYADPDVYESHPECWNGTGWMFVGNNYSGIGGGGGGSATCFGSARFDRLHDGNWGTESGWITQTGLGDKWCYGRTGNHRIYEEAIWWNSNDTIIGSDNTVTNNTPATAQWGGLGYNSTYYWYTNVSDASTTTTSAITTFATKGVPTVSLETTDLITTSNTTPSIDFNFTDNAYTTLACTLWFGGVNASFNGSTINATTTNMTATNNSNPFPAGIYTYYVNCTDTTGANDSAVSSTQTMTIDLFLDPDPPVLNNPPNGSGGISINPVLNATVTDPDSSTLNVTFYEIVALEYQEDPNGSLLGTDKYAYINYTIPSNATSYIWELKHGTNTSPIYNITDLRCWRNGGNNTLQFRVFSEFKGSWNSTSYPECWNGSAWIRPTGSILKSDTNQVSFQLTVTNQFWDGDWGYPSDYKPTGSAISHVAYSTWDGGWRRSSIPQIVGQNGSSSAKLWEEAVWWEVGTPIATVTSVPNNTEATYTWSGRTPNTLYKWKALANDSTDVIFSNETFQFTTITGGSNATVNNPTNGSTNQPLEVVLNATVFSDTTSLLNVTFHPAWSEMNSPYQETPDATDTDTTGILFNLRSNNGAFIFTNYTVPPGAYNYSWWAQHAGSTYTVTDPICWDSNVLQFRAYSTVVCSGTGSPISASYTECYNGTDWVAPSGAGYQAIATATGCGSSLGLESDFYDGNNTTYVFWNEVLGEWSNHSAVQSQAKLNEESITWAFNDTQVLCNNTNVPNNTATTCTWSNLERNTTYKWFVNITDQYGTNQSFTWEFTTQESYNFDIGNFSTLPHDPPYRNENTQVRVDIINNTDVSLIYCNFTITDPNSVVHINNVNGTDNGDRTWDSSVFNTNVSGTWNVSVTCKDNATISHEATSSDTFVPDSLINIIVNYPPNGSTIIDLNPAMNVTVQDINHSTYNISFINADNDLGINGITYINETVGSNDTIVTSAFHNWFDTNASTRTHVTSPDDAFFYNLTFELDGTNFNGTNLNLIDRSRHFGGGRGCMDVGNCYYIAYLYNFSNSQYVLFGNNTNTTPSPELIINNNFTTNFATASDFLNGSKLRIRISAKAFDDISTDGILNLGNGSQNLTINGESILTDNPYISFNVANDTATTAIWENLTIGNTYNWYVSLTGSDTKTSDNFTFTLVGPRWNENRVVPSPPTIGTVIYIFSNVTAEPSGTILSVNYTLTAPNTTNVIDNVNGSNWNTDLWNSTTYQIDIPGVWAVAARAEDNESRTNWNNFTFTVVDSVNLTPSIIQYSTGQNISKLHNITIDTNTNVTFNFSTSYTINDTWFNITCNPDPVLVGLNNITECNITTEPATPPGTYTGLLQFNRSEFDGKVFNVTLNITIAATYAELVIENPNTHWLQSIRTDDTVRSGELWVINNTGNGSVLYINASLNVNSNTTCALQPWASFDDNFDLSPNQTETLEATITRPNPGTYNCYIKLTGYDLGADSIITFDIGKPQVNFTVSAALPEAGGGGGGVGTVCGDGVCDFDENFLSCPEDCPPPNVTTFELSPEFIRDFALPNRHRQYTIFVINQKEYPIEVKAWIKCSNDDSCQWHKIVYDGDEIGVGEDLLLEVPPTIGTAIGKVNIKLVADMPEEIILPTYQTQVVFQDIATPNKVSFTAKYNKPSGLATLIIAPFENFIKSELITLRKPIFGLEIIKGKHVAIGLLFLAIIALVAIIANQLAKPAKRKT